jgi:hypothetical protein
MIAGVCADSTGTEKQFPAPVVSGAPAHFPAARGLSSL